MNLYDNFRLKMMNGNAINFDPAGDTIKLALVTSTYVPNLASDEFWSTPQANEVSGAQYTAGGKALASKTLTLSGGVVTFDAADQSYAQDAAGFSNARRAILYKDTGAASTSPLIGEENFGSDKGNVAGQLDLQFDAAGIITSP